MDPQPVFFDPKGRRRTIARTVGALVAAVAAILTTVTAIVAVFLVPSLPKLSGSFHPSAFIGAPSRDLRKASLLAPGYRRELENEIAKEQQRFKRPPRTPDKVVVGFYAPWEEAGLNSLRVNAAALTDVVPAWLHLDSTGAGLDFGDFDLASNPKNRDVIEIARRNGLRIVPLLSNGSNGLFDIRRVRRLLDSPKAMTAIAKRLGKWLTTEGFQGINLDLEDLTGYESVRLPKLLAALNAEFRPRRLTVSIDIETGNDELPLQAIADGCDWLVLMAYDQHSEDSLPGPICDIDWSQAKLEELLKTVPEEKVVLGIGNYAYDWPDGKRGGESITFQEALSTASGYRSERPSKVIHLDGGSLNNTFAYRDENDQRHVVWMLDAVSAYNQWAAARPTGIRGAALWALGSEDPGIWTFFDRRKLAGPMDASSLERVRFPYEISFTGRGEILRVKNLPQEGRRTIQTDRDSGFIVASKVINYSFPYVLQKSGFVPKKLALTFDDGPDPQWTPQILDVLRESHVPATFFVIGKYAESFPGLVSRMYREGHEIGSHSFTHPNMGAVGDRRNRVELNLTQLAIESTTGRATILFRPPFNADSQPESPEQVQPVVVASRMGYVTVAENVDPTDWDLRVPLAGGRTRPKTANDIVDFIDRDLARRAGTNDEGNIVLLHDAGGDRSQTVAALRTLIPRLRREGYEFVPVSTLMGATRDRVMPPIPAKDLASYYVGKFVLGTAFAGMALLAVAFISAIALGLLRIGLVTPLAALYQRRPRPVVPPGYRKTVTCLIAAYNEQDVIVRTIESVLGSTYPLAEVLVIDDGSSDETSARVRDAFANDPRVRLLVKPNGGKASALNLGLEAAVGEILFCIDADTQLDPAAIGRLVDHFVDPKVAAVAGNVRVGNQVNVLTRWQALEYTTSQNIDRRAYALLNSITVVPGAIGAWRKEAVVGVGGYSSDTLAEDMDLTWRLRRANYRLATESEAYAYTEAPATFGQFFKQRFRWAYGTLQCLWKHRGSLGRHGWFGWFALPTLWLFQILFQSLAPLIDLQVLVSIGMYVLALAGGTGENGMAATAAAQDSLRQVGFLYALFFSVELVAAAIAIRMDRGRYGSLWWMFLQRFAYRQIMYGVIYKSILRAISGTRQGWGKLDRKGTVEVPS